MNIDSLMIDFGQILRSSYQRHKLCQLQVRKKGSEVRGINWEGSEVLDSSSDPLLQGTITISYWQKPKNRVLLSNC